MRKKTLRKMTPLARELGKLMNDLQSARRRIKTIIGKLTDLEAEKLATKKGKDFWEP
jgi:hypothetical protein